tara:strand:- start:77 stop:307 length:231 start_codon:yes stop_codon:yes gene_type:complete
MQDYEGSNHPSSVCECEHKNSTCVTKHCKGRNEALIDAVTKCTSNCHAQDLGDWQSSCYEAGLLKRIASFGGEKQR